MGLFSRKQAPAAPAVSAETAARLEHSERSREVFKADLGTWLDALEAGRKAHGWDRLTDEVLEVAGDKPAVQSTGLDRSGQILVGGFVTTYASKTVQGRALKATVNGEGQEFWQDVADYVADGFSWAA